MLLRTLGDPIVSSGTISADSGRAVDEGVKGGVVRSSSTAVGSTKPYAHVMVFMVALRASRSALISVSTYQRVPTWTATEEFP